MNRICGRQDLNSEVLLSIYLIIITIKSRLNTVSQRRQAEVVCSDVEIIFMQIFVISVKVLQALSGVNLTKVY